MNLPSRLLVLAGVLGLATPAPAQDGIPPAPYPRAAGEVAVLAVNALFSGLTAGVVQKAKGGSFPDGFTRGAVGGAVVYSGKRVAAFRFSGAGAAGRELAAVGSSIVRNAAQGDPSLHELVLPVGPVYLYVRPDAPRALRARVDAVAAAAIVYGVARPELRFDLGESLSSGAAVFVAPNHAFSVLGQRAYGLAGPGFLYVTGPPAAPPSYLRHSTAHERVHVLQADQIFISLQLPLQGRRPRWPLAGAVDVNLAPALTLLTVVLPRHSDRPWEVEANFLAAVP